MKIVIDLPEYLYDQLHDMVSDDYALNDYELAIFNGVPLPKGHGGLVDVDYLIQELSAVPSRPIKSQLYILKEAPTIIEADKAESEE